MTEAFAQREIECLPISKVQPEVNGKKSVKISELVKIYENEKMKMHAALHRRDKEICEIFTKIVEIEDSADPQGSIPENFSLRVAMREEHHPNPIVSNFIRRHLPQLAGRKYANLSSINLDDIRKVEQLDAASRSHFRNLSCVENDIIQRTPEDLQDISSKIFFLIQIFLDEDDLDVVDFTDCLLECAEILASPPKCGISK